MDPIFYIDLEERFCICNSLSARHPLQVRSVSWSEARFGCRQGIHVQSQPETEPTEELGKGRHRCRSPEHHQRRHRLLPVYGQLQ